MVGSSKRPRQSNEKVNEGTKRKLKRPKRLEFEGWGSKNLIQFLQSIGRDTTNRISEFEVTEIVLRYCQELNKRETPTSTSKKKTKTKIVFCDERLVLLFGSKKVKIVKVHELVRKHYVENQEDDTEFSFLYSSEDDEKKRPTLSGKADKEKKVAVLKPKGTNAAIVMDNLKLLYLRKSLVQELAKTPETFESKVVGAFVRIKNPYHEYAQVLPYHLVQVTGVKEGNPFDGYFLEVSNYTYPVNDAPVSKLSDADFSQEECEELHQLMKDSAKKLTLVDTEEKVRNLHEDITKHWLAKELAVLQMRINQANEKGWRRELYEYLDRRELLKKPEEQSRLLREVPEVIAEELQPENVDDDTDVETDFTEQNREASHEVHESDKEEQMSELEPGVADDDGKIENDFIEPNPEASLEGHESDKEELSNNSQVSSDGEQPARIADAADKELHEDAFELPAKAITQNLDSEPPQNKDSEPPANGITQNLDSEPPANVITQNKDSEPPANVITQNMNSIPKIEMIELSDDDDDNPQTQPKQVEIVELSDDDDNDNNIQAIQEYDPKKAMWYYEYLGKTHGPFSLTALKQWNDQEYFTAVPDFKVWTTGNSPVSLTKLLSHFKA